MVDIADSALNPRPNHELLCFLLPLGNTGPLEKMGYKIYISICNSVKVKIAAKGHIYYDPLPGFVRGLRPDHPLHVLAFCFREKQKILSILLLLLLK